MTSSTHICLETVSLHDDDKSPNDLERQMPIGKYAIGTPLMDDEEDNNNTHDLVVIVEHGDNMKLNQQSQPTLPPLRMNTISKDYEENEQDTVDSSLFSPEVTRHSLEQAHRRARALEGELRELEALEKLHPSTGSSHVKITPLEAVTIISTAFVGSVSKMKQLIRGNEYDLLAGTSPSNKCDDLDTDGDGLQLSPDASRGADGKHFIHSPKIKPVLKRVSVYSNLGKDHKLSRHQPQHSRRKLHWHEDVLDHDEEFVEDEEERENGEDESLMVNGGLHRQSTPRSKKKRKKLVRSIMRRLTPREKEELYKERPDLMIIPNWAQKYREELTESESTRWSLWLMVIIGTLATLLLILVMLIAHEHSPDTRVT